MSKRGIGREAEANVLAIYLCIKQEILRVASNNRVVPSVRAEFILESAYNNALCD